MIIWYPFNPLYYNGTPSRSNAALSIVKVLSHGAALLERRSFLCRYHREDFSWLLTVAKHDLFFLHVSKVSKQYGWNMMKSINNIKFKLINSRFNNYQLISNLNWRTEVVGPLDPWCAPELLHSEVVSIHTCSLCISCTNLSDLIIHILMGIAMPKKPKVST